MIYNRLKTKKQQKGEKLKVNFDYLIKNYNKLLKKSNKAIKQNNLVNAKKFYNKLMELYFDFSQDYRKKLVKEIEKLHEKFNKQEEKDIDDEKRKEIEFNIYEKLKEKVKE